MHKLLNQYLKNKGLTFDELTPEERETFYEWTKTLNGRSITEDEVQSELIGQYEKMLSGYFDIEKDLKPSERLEMRAAIRQIRKLLTVMSKPKVEKKALEEILSSQ